MTGSGEKPSPDPGVSVVLSQRKGVLASWQATKILVLRHVKCFHGLLEPAHCCTWGLGQVGRDRSKILTWAALRGNEETARTLVARMGC
jgi:hypothetical protein